MKRFLLLIMMMTAAVIGTAAQSEYYGQCISMQKSAGDSILLDLCICNGFTPKIKDGNVVWEFTFDTTRGMKSYLEENVTAINFRTEDEVRQTVTKALKEFYEAIIQTGAQTNPLRSGSASIPIQTSLIRKPSRCRRTMYAVTFPRETVWCGW